MSEIMNTEVFNTLFKINVNDHTEKKDNLTYLSWPFAMAEAKKHFPDFTYKVHRFGENQLPYVYDPDTGYMVSTEVTINGLTHEMWLPVMDGKNKAMKAVPQKYFTGGGKYEKTVEAATMFDINKTIMRCLVKNLAMFGLGLYIYAGEDLPETTVEDVLAQIDGAKTAQQLKEIYKANAKFKTEIYDAVCRRQQELTQTENGTEAK